jgi:CRP-like cAMP-binding protein
MRRAPRTATVRALTDVCVVAVVGQAFVDAVTGNSDASIATARVIDEYSSEGPTPALP